MHIAQVASWGENPTFKTVPDLPDPDEDQIRIKVEAVGVHKVVRSRAAGKHYSANSLPHTPGIDGVGTTADGRKVYFLVFAPTAMGALSEYVNVAKQDVHLLQDGVDPVQIAALANPASSSWLALKSRTTALPKDFSVLIIGATTASGRIAIRLARALGAKRIIGAARNEEALEKTGVDESIILADEATDFSTLGDVDVILDYIYGPVTEKLFHSLTSRVPVQYVQIGTLGGPSINISGEVLRSKNLTIRGSGPGAWSLQDAAHSLPELLSVLGSVSGPTRTIALKDVEKEWSRESTERLVIIP